eukprot:Platyproteum_vivax@DN4231_c0_g1_i1.p1
MKEADAMQVRGVATFIVASLMLLIIQWKVITFQDGQSISQRAENRPYSHFLFVGVLLIAFLGNRLSSNVILLCYTTSVFNRAGLFLLQWTVTLSLVILATANMRYFHDIHVTASTVYFFGQGLFAILL